MNTVDQNTTIEPENFQKPNPAQHPWLTASQQVVALKSKGVLFDEVSEREAEECLERNNNYFRLASYRRTWPKHEKGPNEGKYISLDFAALRDMSVIDMRLRRELLPMTLDIEHFEKMRLLKRIEVEQEDGYSIVRDFIESKDEIIDGKTYNRIKKDIKRGKTSPYTCDLINRYSDFSYPAWAFMEVIAFGTFIEFYRFCARRFHDKQMKNNYYMLQKVRSTRNACAHNNCLLNNLAAGTAAYKTPDALSTAVSVIKDIGKDSRKSRLSNASLQDIAATLYMHKKIASRGVYKNRIGSLQEFKTRMLKNNHYFEKNLQITSSFAFLCKLIDEWFPEESKAARNQLCLESKDNNE